MALLMYDDLRKMDSPTSTLLDFLESAYQAGRRPPAGTSKVSGTSPPLRYIWARKRRVRIPEPAVHPRVIMQPARAHREWVSSDLQARLFEVEVALDAVHSLVADTALVA